MGRRPPGPGEVRVLPSGTRAHVPYVAKETEAHWHIDRESTGAFLWVPWNCDFLEHGIWSQKRGPGGQT